MIRNQWTFRWRTNCAVIKVRISEAVASRTTETVIQIAALVTQGAHKLFAGWIGEVDKFLTIPDLAYGLPGYVTDHEYTFLRHGVTQHHFAIGRYNNTASATRAMCPMLPLLHFGGIPLDLGGRIDPRLGREGLFCRFKRRTET